MKRKLDPFSPEGIKASLADDEKERQLRDKKVIKMCPICGPLDYCRFRATQRPDARRRFTNLLNCLTQRI